MTTDIARRSDFPLEVDQQLTMAKALADAGVLPGHLRRQPANILAIGMAARALDIPTWTALQQVVPIDGKISIQADLMRALILRAGHRFRVERADAEAATVVIVRADDPDFEHRVTVEIGEIPAELRRKTNWQNYPADMLVARSTAKAARRACSDVLNGLSYTPDELGADTDDEGRPLGPPNQGRTPPPTTTSTAASASPPCDDDQGDVVDAEVVDDPPHGYDPSYDDAQPGTEFHVRSVVDKAAAAGAGRDLLDADIASRYAGRTLDQLTRGQLRDEWTRWSQDSPPADTP